MRDLCAHILAFVVTSGAAAVATAQCTLPGAAIDPARELVVMDPLTTQDLLANPGGPWHFGTAVQRLLPLDAPPSTASDLVLAWFSQFDTAQTLRSHPELPAGADNPDRAVARRLRVWSLIITPWLAKSKALRADQGLPEDGSLAMSLAPFKLVAIVNRLDLRDPAQCATAGGEGRFVFVALKEPTADPIHTDADGALNFTVIFEYDQPTAARGGFGTAQEWAKAWHALNTNPCTPQLGCASYNSDLASLTARFAGTLAQIRTNDVLTFPGELREFKVGTAADGRLAIQAAPVQQTPDISLNKTATLATWANEARAQILSERFQVPDALSAFTAPYPRLTTWTYPGADEEVRAKLAKNTCNGCHSFEHPAIASVDGAYHVSPHAELSGYMTDIEVPRRTNEMCQLLLQPSCTDVLEARGAPRKVRVH